MKKVLISFVLFVVTSVSAEAAIQTFSASDTGGAMRTKLNSNFSELNTTKETKAVVQAAAPADTSVDWYDTDQEAGVLILKRHNGTTWVRASSHGVQYATSCAGITGGMCVDTDDGKLYYHNGTSVVEVGTGSGSYTLPTATDAVLGGVKVGSRLTITDGVLSADVQITDISGKQDLLVSGTNIKTINSTSLLGSGNIDISGGSMTWPSVAGIAVYGGSNAWGTSLTLDNDLSSVSASDDSLPSAKATKDALDQKANSTGISFIAAALSDLKYDPNTGVADDEFQIIDASATYGGTYDDYQVWPVAKVGSELASKIGAAGVTYENLNTNGDVGTGAGQLSIGNHTHSGVYEPADVTILKSAAIGSTVQGYDADLATWAGVTSSANGRSLVSAADYAAMRTLLDLEQGVDFYSMSAADTAFQKSTAPVFPVSVSTTTATGNINIDGVSADHYYFSNGSSTATYTPVMTSRPASGKERAIVLTVGGGTGVITMTWTNVSFIGTAGAATTTAGKYNHYGCFIPSSGNAKCKVIAEASDN